MESIRPSGQHFSVDVALAAAYGLEEAFLIHHFMHWIRINRDRGINLHEGRTWTYQTLQQIADHFPFLDYQQVKYAIASLEKFGILRKGNYNKDPMDKTTWYSFEDEQLFVPSISRRSKNVYDSGNSPIDSGKPIMDSGNSPIYIGKMLKSEDSKREQQQPAAAAAVFSCLKNENRLTKSDIDWLMKFTEAEVEEALKYTQEEADQGKIKTTFSQTIKWAIKEKPKRTPKVHAQENRKIAERFEYQWRHPHYRLDSCPESAMIIALGAQMEPKVISYDEPDFANKLKDTLCKMGFLSTETVYKPK